MSLPTDETPRWASCVDYVLFLGGVIGLTFAITSVWLGMRAVMDIGGYCCQFRSRCTE